MEKRYIKNNIIFKKVWQDNEFMELKVICYSDIVTIISKIYVSNSMLDDLICRIKQFLDDNIEEGLWKSEDRGNTTLACLILRFLRKDRLGHILIEVFAELDDGGDYTKHNCCFFVNTEYGLLLEFCAKIEQLKEGRVNYEIQLNS